VYKLDGEHHLVVHGAAQLTGDVLAGWPSDGTAMNDTHWKFVETCLQLQIEDAIAASTPFDASSRADAAVTVYVPPPPGPPDPLAKRIGKGIVTAITLIVLVVVGGGIYFLKTIGHSGRIANGASCTFDHECASDYCHILTCRIRNPNYANGERCDYSTDCASHSCLTHVCVR
jgi:hypothetical protein